MLANLWQLVYGKGSKPGRRYVSLLCLEKGFRLVILSSSAFAKGKEKEKERDMRNCWILSPFELTELTAGELVD